VKLLKAVLLRTIEDTSRNRAYQAGLDSDIDALIKDWDLDRGLIGAAGVGPGALPHEVHPDYWQWTAAQQASHTSDEHARIYLLNRGREGTAVLCQAAFCWHSPLSRHHHDPRLKQFFENGLRFHVDSIRPDGLLGSFGYNGMYWAHGWDIEGLIYGIVLLDDQLDGKLLDHAKQRLRACAERMMNYPRQQMIIGSFGNQRCVFTLGLHLYGQLLDEPRYIAESDRYWLEALDNVLDPSGQVIEQMAPCMHYSHTAFIYAWMNLVVRNDLSQTDRILKCLHWFRDRLTASLYPFAGPTSRMYLEKIGGQVQDLCPAIEQVAPRDPSLLTFMSRALWRAMNPAGPIPSEQAALNQTLRLNNPHAASTAMWSILMAGPQAVTQTPHVSAVAAGGYDSPVTCNYDTTRLHKRAPLKYMLVRRGYQTSFSFNDFMPFAGIQTWAWADEPPIVHPTPLAPSTTRGDGLDTARQGASHNWAGYGAGAIGVDGYPHEPHHDGDDNDLQLLVVRYDWLFRVVLFTECSTVILELGDNGPRRTLWTLNRIDPAQPMLASDANGASIVRFTNRKATLHASLTNPPQVITLDDQHEWATGVKQLRYDITGVASAFGLSNGSLQLPVADITAGNVFRFADESGRYEVELSQGLLRKPNPGCFSIDTFVLAQGTVARRK
jgi:hypothetical protein